MDKKLFSITVDVETDWGGRLPAKKENCRGIDEGIPQLLLLFKSFKIKATFFISGSIALLYKDLIREINSGGHEIGSHGYDHSDYKEISRAELEFQLKESKETLEGIINKKVLGFRSPRFKVHPCLYECLYEAGYLYDSSLVSAVLIGRYGRKNMPKRASLENGLLKIPVSNIPATNKPFGLLWVNHLGFRLFSILSKLAPVPQNTVMYLHPFDIIANKSKCNYPMHVKLWYSFTGKKPLACFTDIINYYHKRGFRFITMQNYINEEF